MTIEENIPLAPYTTLGIGGPARYFARVTTEAELVEAVEFARGRGLRFFTVGGGSNLVVPDAGFDGLVMRVATGGAIRTEGGLTTVDGGVDWDGFVLHTCEQNLSGVECMAGIPGLVGGAPIQNIGAYGQEVSSTIEAVRALDLATMRLVSLTHAECGFGYRSSIFNSIERGRYIVTRVGFRFDPMARPRLGYADLRRHFGEGAEPSAMEIYEAVRQIRDGKGMLIDGANRTADSRSAGSFFKNPVVPVEVFEGLVKGAGLRAEDVPHWVQGADSVKLAAAWLIEHAGFAKGYSLGEAGISSRHTLALINRTGHASCADLLALRDRIAAEVLERFGVGLEQEPVTLV